MRKNSLKKGTIYDRVTRSLKVLVRETGEIPVRARRREVRENSSHWPAAAMRGHTIGEI